MATTPALSIRGLSKSFVDDRPVLRSVDLAIEPGEIRALLGANGSGKSTLIKILAGYHAPDPGSSIDVGGEELSLPVDPQDVRRRGLRFVHQDSALVPGLTVVDNLRLGGSYDCGPGWKIRWKQEAQAARAEFRRLGLDIDPLCDVEGLSLATAAKLSILRALQRAGGEPLKLVVLDEPTASLGREDAAHVMSWVRQLARDEGVGVLLVSHRLSEVLDIADSVSILRNGQLVATGPVAEFPADRIVEHIVGRRIEAYYPDRSAASSRPVLDVRGLTGGAVQELSFTACRGEILGLTGLAGSGFEDVPYLIGDRRPVRSGECELDGRPLSLRTASVVERVRRGLALVPADRVRTAVAADLGARDNLVLPRLSHFFRRGLLRRGPEQADARRAMDALQVVPADPEMAVEQFSGGNQQKIVLGKWLATSPKVLLLHEPTQGVDVGARSQIFAALADFAAAGGAVVVASLEYEDLAHVCDRVLVFGHGRVDRELHGSGLSAGAVTSAAYLADAAGADPQRPAVPVP